MPTELFMLVLTVLLYFILVAARAIPLLQINEMSYFPGNRDDAPNTNDTVRRIERTIDNHRDGLLFFAPVVLAGAAAGGFNGATALAAQIYFASRLVHAICYIMGITYVRTLVWVIGIVAWLTIVVQVAF